MSHIIKCDGVGCAALGADMAVPAGWYTLIHQGHPAEHFHSATCLGTRADVLRERSYTTPLSGTIGSATGARWWRMVGTADTDPYGEAEYPCWDGAAAPTEWTIDITPYRLTFRPTEIGNIRILVDDQRLPGIPILPNRVIPWGEWAAVMRRLAAVGPSDE